MRYDNLRAFEKHLESASPQHFSPIYAIIGKENYDCREAVRLLQNFLIADEKKEMTLQVWDGASCDPQSLLDDLYSLSFFTDKRVILIKNVDKIKKSLWEKLEKYLSRPSKSQFLILVGEPLSRQTAIYKLLEREGIILEFADLKPWEKEKKLIEWVNKQANAARKMMSHQVCQQFVKQIGMDQELLANEMEKLLCFMGSKQEILLQDVAQICTRMPNETVWQLGEAIFRRDVVAALKMIQALLLEQAFLLLLRQIRSQFVTEYHVCLMLEQGREASSITQEYPYMKGQILERHIENARGYGIRAFKQGLLDIDATEMQAKNGFIDESLLAEILITKLTKKQ